MLYYWFYLDCLGSKPISQPIYSTLTPIASQTSLGLAWNKLLKSCRWLPKVWQPNGGPSFEKNVKHSETSSQMFGQWTYWNENNFSGWTIFKDMPTETHQKKPFVHSFHVSRFSNLLDAIRSWAILHESWRLNELSRVVGQTLCLRWNKSYHQNSQNNRFKKYHQKHYIYIKKTHNN